MTPETPVRPALWRLLVPVAAVAALAGWWLGYASPARQRDRAASDFWVICHPENSAAHRARAFLRLAAAGNTEWRSSHLYQLNFEGAFLRGASVWSADFANCIFSNATLAKADFSKSLFHLADLSGADLADTRLEATEFYRAKLNGASLARANLRGAVMPHSEAVEADFSDASLAEANLMMADLSRAKFADADLTGVNLESATLRGTRLDGARLDGAKWKDADFAGANWWRARGIPPAQLQELMRTAAPGEDAATALRADYETWRREAPANLSLPANGP